MEKTNFKNIAAKKQLAFFVGKNQTDITNREGRSQAHWLQSEFAEKGEIFYSDYDVFENVVKNRKNNKKTPEWFFDTLRSQHIPYNLFIPLISEKELCVVVFNSLFFSESNSIQNDIIKTIVKIEIEYPPAKDNPLGDRTSFDAYVEYISEDDKIGLLGIEVKYTEGGYSPKKAEKERILSEDSVYDTISSKSGLYNSQFEIELKKNKNRQIWRNHLLAYTFAKKRGIESYKSVTFYPEGNKHFVDVCRNYKKFLTEIGFPTIMEVTYERYFETIKKYSTSWKQIEWVEYLKSRYLV